MENKLSFQEPLPQISSKIEFKIENNNENNNELNKINTLDNIKKNKLDDEKTQESIVEPVEEMDFDQNKINIRNIKSRGTLNSIIKHEATINPYKVKIPKDKIKEQIIPLEQELFSLLNINYGEEII